MENKRIHSARVRIKKLSRFTSSALGLVTISTAFASEVIKGADAPSASSVTSTVQLNVGGAQVRTWEQMRMEENLTPFVPQAAVPFRSTMGDAAYAEAKAAAAAALGEKPPSPTLPTQIPIVLATDFDGINSTLAGGGFPPDTHGAVGTSQYVQVTNNHIDVYNLAGVPLFGTSLNAFFGYFTQTIFDPRVVYDSTWNRWVISAEAFPESPTVQLQFLGISLTSDATGPFFSYGFNVLLNPNFFWDFPQLGMDQDAVIITANYFNGPAFVDARTFAIAKARVYNGLGFSVPVFIGLCGTLAPPVVLDQNDKTFVVCAPTAGTTITKYTMTNSSRPGATALVSSTITVPAYGVPPCASQGAGNPCLDTSDARFVNASTQNGNSLWNTHTIALGAFPAPKYYEFDTAANMVVQSGSYFASGTSFDWNASITANANRDVFVTWSNTDPPTQAQVRFSGRCHGDPVGMIASGTAVKTSPTFSSQFDGTRFRWGDYSAAAAEPGNPNNAWIVNEWTLAPPTWGSHITQIGFSPVCP